MTTPVSHEREQSPLLQRIAEDYHCVLQHYAEHGDPFRSFRARAIEELYRLGIPTVRHEEWKYTNLYTLLNKGFTIAATDVHDSDISAITKEFERWGHVAVVQNGIFAASVSEQAVSLKEAAASDPILLSKVGSLATIENNAIVAWNAAFSSDGVAIKQKEAEPVEPLVLVSVVDASENNCMVHERHIVDIAPGASATLVLVQRSRGEGHALLNQVLEGWIGENASLTVLVIQDAASNSHTITTHEFDIARSGRLLMVSVSIGGGFVRNMPAARLSGEGADARLYGLTIADGTMLVDHHTTVDHRVPHSTSDELYKAILDERSTGVFNGKIYVRPKAQKTSAYQANRNIVLSPRATINTKPQLEIFADDVRCTHGCTVGKLDGEALFYLQARGLSKKQAEALLLTAFAGEIIGKIPYESIRSEMLARVEHLLHSDELA
ncbi:MAG: Fe-S cluster assembly protein SufD [Chlorobi bacterium]|nr:Fe-S cluster assembly protein SufD [Chlorobiota bacterium]